MQRLGQNHGGYRGETIEITAVLREIQTEAQAKGWRSESLRAGDLLTLPVLTRPAVGVPVVRRAYISAGIHGDEPAGPLAVLQLLREDLWPAALDLWLCPCLNPTGFPFNRRENATGVDLNRQYLHLEAPEVRAHTDWLQCQPMFDVTICLHEDWEANGFYLYELNPDNRPTPAGEVIRRVTAVCPIDYAEMIEERPANGGIIRPNIDPRSRPQWPEAFWLLTHKTRHSFTLEAPSDFPLATRVASLVTATQTIIESM